MASIILKWLRRCLFICVCAFFLMSHNASAMTSVSVTPVGSGNWCINGSNVTDATVTCHLIQNLTTDTTVVANNMDIVVQGSYYTDTVLDIELTFYRNSNTTSTHAGVNGIESLSSNWALMSYEYQQLNSNTGVIHLFVKSLTNNNSQHILISGHQNFFYVLQPGDRVAGANVGIYAINNTVADYSSIVNAIQSQPNYTQNLNNINNGINNINNSINNINDEEQDATQDAADTAADSGDQSAADAENATAGLISVIGGFVNAITSATPTNCKINGKINNSFNMGELDLCAMPVPSFVQIISSLILIAICIPFAIVMFNRFIGLFRSFQG